MDPQTPAPSAQPPVTSPDPSPTATDQAPVATAERTPEEIEAYWRERQGKQEKAHLAAEQVLRDEIESLRRSAMVTQPQNGQPANGLPTVDPRLAELERQVQEEKVGRIVDRRKLKYPALAARGANDSFFASSDEAFLAKLNSELDDAGGTPLIAPTTPKRATPAAAKQLREKSKEELLDDLKRTAPAYEAWQREQQNR